MKTYLNELHKHYKDNRSTNNILNTPSSSNILETNNLSNKLMKNKSGVLLNNCFRTTNVNNNKNVKINNSKKSENNSNKNLKNFKKKKKLNVTPFQDIKNEYFLNLAMDNLNKYQENILFKENIENNLNGDNLDLNKENILNEDYGEYNTKVNNSKNKNNRNNISNKKYHMNQIMNKTQESFNNSKLNNNNLDFLNNDLLLSETKNDQFNVPPNPEPYISYKNLFKNNSFNYRISDKNKINNIKNTNFDKNYENKFNAFINKTFDLNNENSKKSNISNNNNLTNKTNEIFDKKLNYVLENLELKELTEIFKKNYIFFDDLFLLNKEDFIEMNIPIGPRNRIINFIEKYKNIANTYDLEELKFFMDKYKHILIDPKDIIIVDNINITPSTNDKYKSTMTSENNKNKVSFESHGSDIPGKISNMSNFNFEDLDTLSPRREETQINRYINLNPKNKNRKRFLDENNFNNEKNNKIIKEINDLINITNEKIFKNNQKDDIKKKNNEINNINENTINNTNNIINKNNNEENIEKCFTSRIKNKYNQFINLNDDNNNNENNDNLFTNSLFNEFSGNNNNINETLNINNNNNEINNNTNNIIETTKNDKNNINNILQINQNNSLINENGNGNLNKLISSNLSNNIKSNDDNNNKKKNENYSPNIISHNSKNKNIKSSKTNNNSTKNHFKNIENIFSEIENYQINYEKMKKENDNRNNKIKFLLEKKNRPNIQYLKTKIKNSKYYNEDDLKNESTRDLNNELQKMNIQKDKDNNQINSLKDNSPIQNYLKARNKKINNPLIEQFNNHK